MVTGARRVRELRGEHDIILNLKSDRWWWQMWGGRREERVQEKWNTLITTKRVAKVVTGGERGDQEYREQIELRRVIKRRIISGEWNERGSNGMTNYKNLLEPRVEWAKGTSSRDKGEESSVASGTKRGSNAKGKRITTTTCLNQVHVVPTHPRPDYRHRTLPCRLPFEYVSYLPYLPFLPFSSPPLPSHTPLQFSFITPARVWVREK